MIFAHLSGQISASIETTLGPGDNLDFYKIKYRVQVLTAVKFA